MANETPHHTYREITDNPGDNPGCAWFASGCLFIIASPFVLLTILAFVFDWQIIQWVFLSLSALLILLALIERLSFCKLPNKLNAIVNRPSPRLSEAQRAKDFLGFDFGTDFRLRTTGSHDYSEILLDFNDEPFIPLKEFCMSQTSSATCNDSKTIIMGSLDYILVKDGAFTSEEKTIKPGYTKIENNYDPGLKIKDIDCLNEISGFGYAGTITSQWRLEVDYECRTLKMSWTGW